MLVTVERYRIVTGDTTTAASAVSAAIEEATDLLSEDLGWQIEEDERTETLNVIDGRVYPSAVPITAVEAGQTIDGYSVTGAAPLGSDFLTEGFEGDVHRATLTYTGGWTADTLPSSIRRAICWAARGILTPSAAEAVPDGATSVRLGDASVTYATAQTRATTGITWPPKVMRWHLKHRRVAA